ncbi:MAG: YraN family protein [Dehalococcoidales bacterium]|nr:YraN family protein [Dehalococcoidales bacterium]
MKRRETGMLGEKLARDYLEKKDYHVIETNYRCSDGEIDIIAKHKDFLVFVEVRTKTSLKFGSPEESVTPTKKARLKATAYHYIQNHEDLPLLWRIDFVAIELGLKGKILRIELIENAVNDG